MVKFEEQGEAESQFSLGICYSFGKGVPVDKEKNIQILNDSR